MKTYVTLMLCGCFLLACSRAKQSQLKLKKHATVSTDTVEILPVVSTHKSNVQRCFYGDSLTIELNITKIHKDTLKVGIYSKRQTDRKLLSIQKINRRTFTLLMLPNVELSCTHTGFALTYEIHQGNNYKFYTHIFELRNSASPKLKEMLERTVTIQYIYLSGGVLQEGIPISAYNVNNLDSVNVHSIKLFSIEGYRSGNTFSVEQYMQAVKKTDNHQLLGDPIVLDAIFHYTSIDAGTVVAFNNIAYYLQQSGAFEGAIFLLEKIVKRFPDRTVAYINLGDAYWGLDKKAKAQKAYRTYVQQMKTAGKSSIIPQRVTERLR